MCWLCAGLQAQQQKASQQTSGIPPLVQSAVLTDRRHILTKDAEGNVELWDIATGAVEQRFGKVAMHCLTCCPAACWHLVKVELSQGRCMSTMHTLHEASES